jgi:GrpB-like predicted nucleotidyltransferase (UPF0157 family)
MKKINDLVLYFHDYMADEEQTQEEVKQFKREFAENGIQIDKIETTEIPPFNDKQNYDILLFDWGGASMGNSMLDHFCKYILEEAIEKPSKIFIMVSTFTVFAMEEALSSFEKANGELPANVFLKISDACKLLVN